MLSLLVCLSSKCQDVTDGDNKFRITVSNQQIKGPDNNDENILVAVFKDTVFRISEFSNAILAPNGFSIGFIELTDNHCALKIYDTTGVLINTHYSLPRYFTSNMLLFESGYFTYFGTMHDYLRSLNDTTVLFVFNNEGRQVFQNEPWDIRSISWYQIPQTNITMFSGSIIDSHPLQLQLVLLQDFENETIVLSKTFDDHPDSEISYRISIDPELKLISVYYYSEIDHNIDSLFFKYSSSSIYSNIENRE